ncbi:MAG: hypothetical protein CME63_01885 [Halobacteriovoraceae bacterium]|nr:hypothetical protein [Halobacteriovoraceae bacterium]MBC96473.1 hypothetical protein [Halobacteriovoraceae bacterium]
MKLSFVRYFFSYLIHAKTRQRLLFIAIFGLILSSFALIVLQSTMGGLQSKLIARSKRVTGHGVVEFSQASEKEVRVAIEELKESGLYAVGELELELLIKYGQYYAPILIHGINPTGDLPRFIEGRVFDELILPRSLSLKVNAAIGDLVRLLSPAHLDSFMGDIPRMSSLYVDYLVSTDVQEVDEFHGWANLLRIQSLIKKRTLNRIRLFDPYDKTQVELILRRNGLADASVLSWEEKNSTLVWALGLETTVMVFLFAAMTLLVSLAIISGLLIFFTKVKGDMASFWILGTEEREIFKSSRIFLFSLSFFSVTLGLFLGLGFLYGLDYFGPNIMPDVFVDRKIPVAISTRGVLLSFSIPFFISLFFANLSLKAFRKDVDYLSYIRTLGR